MAAPSSPQRASSVVRNRLLGKYFFRGLGMGADDEWRLHVAQTPATGDALGLAGRTGAVRSGADHLRIGASLDTAQKRIVAAVEELLHHAGEGSEVFRRAEDVAIGTQHVIGAGVFRGHQARLDLRFGGTRCGLRHLAAAAGSRMIDDEELRHGPKRLTADLPSSKP